MQTTGQPVTDNLIMLVFNRTHDTLVAQDLTPEVLETIRVNQFVIDHLAHEVRRKNELIDHLAKLYQK